MTVEVRAATEADVDAIRAVGAATWPPTYAFAGDAYVAHGLATWWSEEATLHSLRDTRMLLAVRDDQVVGVGNLDLRTDPPTIWKLYVAPPAQGTGAGSALLRALQALARAEGAGEVVLEYVDGNDRAAAFYRRHGFTELRREAGEQPDRPETVWMRWRAPTRA